MRKFNHFVGSCIAVFTLIAFSSVVYAQTTTSTIEGTVTDPNGAVIAGATVRATAGSHGSERSVVTDDQGFYRLVALPAGTYTLTISQAGFTTGTYSVELTLNRVAAFDVRLNVGGGVAGEVLVTSELPLLEPTASSSGQTITPRQIQDLPVNGREYLDLLQLVPGVAINRQSTGDNANPVLGERSGNNNFFIDGQPNKDTVSGGAAAAVQPGDDRRVSGDNDRFQGRIRTGVRSRDKRHHQERRELISRHGIVISQKRIFGQLQLA